MYVAERVVVLLNKSCRVGNRIAYVRFTEEIYWCAKTVNGFNEKSKLCDGLITEGSRMSSGVDWGVNITLCRTLIMETTLRLKK